jgi:hypothetical protein
MTSSTRCSPSATRPRPIDRGLQRRAVAAARVGRPADDVDVRAAGLQRLLAQDRLGAGVDRLGAGVVAAQLERLDAVVPVSVADRTGPFFRGRRLLTRRTCGSTPAVSGGGCRPAPVGAAIDGGRPRTLASSATTAAVATAAGTARRTTTRPFTSRTLR